MQALFVQILRKDTPNYWFIERCSFIFFVNCY